MSNFKKGDYVIVKPRDEIKDVHEGPGYVPEMKRYGGMKTVIKNVSNRYCSLEIDSGQYTWMLKWLNPCSLLDDEDFEI